jgi:hypothetical protein
LAFLTHLTGIADNSLIFLLLSATFRVCPFKSHGFTSFHNCCSRRLSQDFRPMYDDTCWCRNSQPGDFAFDRNDGNRRVDIRQDNLFSHFATEYKH